MRDNARATAVYAVTRKDCDMEWEAGLSFSKPDVERGSILRVRNYCGAGRFPVTSPVGTAANVCASAGSGAGSGLSRANCSTSSI
jgi:hypothetical protein